MNLRAIQVTALMSGALIFQGVFAPHSSGAEAPNAPATPAPAAEFVPETPQETAGRLMAERWVALLRSWFKGGAHFVDNTDQAAQAPPPVDAESGVPAPWTQRPLCGPVALAHYLAPLMPGAGAQPNPEEWLQLYANAEQRARFNSILADITRVFVQRGMNANAAREAAIQQVFTRWDLYEHLIKFGTADPRTQLIQGARNPYDPSAISSDATDYYNRGLLFQRMGNFKDAAGEYERATRSQHAMAQASLAYLYETGQGINRDLMKAMELYQLAAKQGHSVAQYNLGRIHQLGLKHLNQVVTPNPVLAEQYLRRAAAQGVVAAYHQLGILYHTQGGRVNLAALKPEQLKQWDKDGDGKITSAENRLFQDAHDHFLLAARQNYGPSLHALGVMYQRGTGVRADLARAAHWLEQAVKHEIPDSLYNLAQL